MLLKSKLRWAGYVSRMVTHRLHNVAVYVELTIGHCDRGAPKNSFKGPLKKTITACRIDHHQRSTLAADRHTWCRTVHQVLSTFEDSRRANPREKRHRRKIKRTSAAVPNQTLNYNRLDWTCQSRISMPSVDVDILLHISSFAKTS